MKNHELLEMSISELRELNTRVVETIRLKMRIDGQKNLDKLKVGDTVKYKGSSVKISNETFKVLKLNKVNAQCKSLKTGVVWNIKLANIEPIEVKDMGFGMDAFKDTFNKFNNLENLFEKEPESGFHS